MEEILGPINSVYFTIKMQEGIVATSYSKGDQFYINPEKLLPLERFLPQPKGAGAHPRPRAHPRPCVRCGAAAACRTALLLPSVGR